MYSSVRMDLKEDSKARFDPEGRLFISPEFCGYTVFPRYCISENFHRMKFLPMRAD